VILLALLVAVAGCSRLGRKGDPSDTLPVEQLYSNAHDLMEGGNLSRAAHYYERLIARFPFGAYTEQAQLDLAYTQYKDHKEEDAYSTINRFIKTYPTQKHIDYAYYLRGLINFNRSSGLLERYIDRDQAKRDQGFSQQSFDDFGELVKRYPNSAYAPDGRQRMIYLRNNMAQAELNIAMYYLRRHAYVAASNRAEHMLETFQETPQIGDALAILTMSYKELGQDKLSEDAKRVLATNYPDHPLLKGEWPPKRRYWKRMVPFINR